VIGVGVADHVHVADDDHDHVDVQSV